MTISADFDVNDDNAKPPALIPTCDIGGIDPFVAAAPHVERRGFGARLLDYSAHAAMIVGLIGFAWTVSNHVVKPPAAPSNAAAHAAIDASAQQRTDELADLRRTNQQMADDVRRLHASLDTLRNSVREDKTSAQVRVLQAGLDNVQSGLNAARTETTSAMSQLNGKVEKIEPSAAKLQQLSERLGKLEKGNVDLSATGSIGPGSAKSVSVPTPPTKPVPAKLANTDDARKIQEARKDDAGTIKPQVIAGYVVRDVYAGVALIESKRGPIEVVPGVSIPGAGVVKSIDRHGSGWTVTTTKGLLAYAAPQRDYRRSARDGYPGYRYDF